MRIKQTAQLLILLLSLTLLLTLTACGGGGGGGSEGDGGGTTLQAQKVTATFALQGGATIVGSVDLEVVLPVGFVLETDNTAQPTASSMTLLVNGATSAVNYTPATIAANGEILVAIIKSDGFVGNTNLIQMSHIYAAGTTLPTADDFMVTVGASDLNGVPLTGITAQVSISNQAVP